MSDARTITAEMGGRWFGTYGLAYCPAHQNEVTPALSVGTGREGQLLLSCKAGCTFAEVVAALNERGLSEGSGGASARLLGRAGSI